jgi:AcrR family transcriptional regulator
MATVETTREMPEHVLIKAAELIRDKGFDATSVNEISQAVGITKGGLYYYIKGKRDLLYRIMLRGLQLVESLAESVEHLEDPQQQLRALIRGHIKAIARGKGALTVLSEEVHALDEEHRDEILQMKRRYYHFVRGILERLRNDGKLRDADLSVAAFNILGMVLHFARWYRVGGRLDPVEIADEMVDLALSGLYRHGADGSSGKPAGH